MTVEAFEQAREILSRPALGAVRARGARLRAAISTDPQARALWEIRVAVAELQRYVDRGDRVDDMREHLRRALAIAERDYVADPPEALSPSTGAPVLGVSDADVQAHRRRWAEHDRRLEDEGRRMAALARATVETP